ncbi:hypothetical protein GCM10020229_10310 [Kitasatospora albolonga]|uniref:hypothetical protein n=1 Tax=Kitasatospora albolonga TaxID=68173 RepID=UPI0031E5A393
MDWAALPLETEFKGEGLGWWVPAQQASFVELDEEQQDLLSVLGFDEGQELAAARAKVAAG